MDTFQWVPTVANYSGTTTTVVRSAQFGDGYQQRAADGLNNVSSQFSLQFMGDAAKIRAIRTFLAEKAGAESCYWTPELDDEPIAVYCETWSRATKDGDVYTMTATFQQSFAIEQDSE